MKSKLIQFFIILLLIVLISGYNKLSLNKSTKKYNLDQYLETDTYDYVRATKVIRNQNENKRKFMEREDTNKDIINKILQYFNSFEYTEDQNKKSETSAIIYEFALLNTKNYKEIEIHIISNKKLNFLLKEKSLGKKNTILFLKTDEKEFDMDYIEQLYNSLSNEL